MLLTKSLVEAEGWHARHFLSQNGFSDSESLPDRHFGGNSPVK